MFKSKKMVANEIASDANEITRDQTELQTKATTKRGRTEWTSLILSFAALFLSAVSLYQTVLKQANLNIFVPETISYTRDAEGNHEVFIIPLTITNSGARDGVVSALKLVGTNKATGETLTFKASYFAKADYFLPPRSTGQTRIAQRPKEPYSPIPVSGYSAYGGTVLFYPVNRGKKTFMPGEGEYDFTLSLNDKALEEPSIFDVFGKKKNTPITFTAVSGKVANYFPGWITSGNTWRMSIKDN